MAAWQEATASCHQATSYAGALDLTGRIGSQRIRGLASATLYVVVTAAGSVGMEAQVSGELIFKLAGSAERAVLLLREENRVVTAPAADILDALVGVRLSPQRLLAVLTGCVSVAGDFAQAARHDGILKVTASDATVFLRHTGEGWQARAGDFDDLAVDYDAVDDGLPRHVVVRSVDGRAPVVRLEMTAQQVELNADRPAAVFTVNVPDAALPMSLDELRRSGPVAPDGDR